MAGFDAGRDTFRDVPRMRLGNLPIAVLDRDQTADLMISAALNRWGGNRPLILSSANGEAISRCWTDPSIARLFARADLLSADGQSLVFASRFCGLALPERVATTDLFHDVAHRAARAGATFYLFGATETVNREATRRAQILHPGLRIVGRCHGYLRGEALEKQISEIRALSPDILWVALGIPHEQAFCDLWASKLDSVGVIKTSGGLFDFLAGARRRAPKWVQAIGCEWAFRVVQEPRRLWWRYAVTNPHAAYLLLTQSGRIHAQNKGRDDSTIADTPGQRTTQLDAKVADPEPKMRGIARDFEAEAEQKAGSTTTSS